MTTRAQRIELQLRHHLQPRMLQVHDDSGMHAGHAGAQPGGETHYSVALVSALFRGKSRVERSRMVHALLADEFTSGLHALALSLKSDEEADTAEATAKARLP